MRVSVFLNYHLKWLVKWPPLAANLLDLWMLGDDQFGMTDKLCDMDKQIHELSDPIIGHIDVKGSQ